MSKRFKLVFIDEDDEWALYDENENRYYDIEHDTITNQNDKFKFILKSKAFDEWYKEDIKELRGDGE